MRLFLFINVFLVLLVSGCSPWNPVEKKSALVFPKSRIAPDAVGLEVAVVQIDSDQEEDFETYWRQLDSQELPVELRKRLDQNGVRVGVMASHPPTVFHGLVGPRTIDPASLSKFERELHKKRLLRPQSRMVEHTRISNREGQSHPVSVSGVHPEISWIVRSENQQTVGAGKTVQGVMTVTTYPQGDGSVRLVIRPEIHHGLAKTRIGVAERSYLMKSGQSVTPVDELKFDVSLRSGESIVLAPTSDVADLGELLFGIGGQKSEVAEPKSSKPVRPKHRMLMIRVVQTQMDDLFSDNNLGEKLTTTPRY